MTAADDRTNPKDLAGRAKVDLSLFPPVAMIHAAHAFMDGAEKYGPFNWREKYVRARVYVAAAMRHLASYLDGEDTAFDSDAHHLGHAIACCAIILDATETGKLVDDRPIPGSASLRLARLADDIAERRAAKAVDESWARAAEEDRSTVIIRRKIDGPVIPSVEVDKAFEPKTIIVDDSVKIVEKPPSNLCKVCGYPAQNWSCSRKDCPEAGL